MPISLVETCDACGEVRDTKLDTWAAVEAVVMDLHRKAYKAAVFKAEHQAELEFSRILCPACRAALPRPPNTLRIT